jgi:WD40 repeat protein
MTDSTPQPEALAAEATPRPDAAERLYQLWRQGERPDVDDFLARLDPLPPFEVAAALRVDQRERWRLGEGVPAEAYLQRHPSVADDAEASLDLIFNEFLVRGRCGDSPTLDEFLARFPEHAEMLRAQIELHRAVIGSRAGAEGNLLLPLTTPEVRDDSASRAQPVVPGYEVLGEVGRGGMGVIYKARQQSLNRLVALKMISAGVHAGSAERARLSTEAEAAARLRHPNVVQIYEVGSAAGLPYLALEWMDGGSLAQVLGGRPLAPRAAAELVGLLARAVQAAHEQGVVHRDLKPANILFTGSGVPKVADFGLAKDIGAGVGQTASATVLGTPSYMAPEQAAGQAKHAGPACDIYALGAILYECLTGSPPFRGATPLETLDLVRSREPELPSRLRPGLPRDLVTVCLKAMAREPARRYPSAAAFADDLERFLADRPVTARPVRRWEQGWRWCRRNPALAGALGLALLLLVAVAGVSSLAAWRLNKAQAETSAQLWESLREQAHARSLSRLPGRREESLDALSRAAAIRPAPQLRDDAIACLALLDFRAVKELPPLPTANCTVAFDHGLDHYAFADAQGDLIVCRGEDGQEAARLAGVGKGAIRLYFSPDGRWLFVTQHEPFAPTEVLTLWDWRTGRRLLGRTYTWPLVSATGFSPDGQQFFIKNMSGPLVAFDVLTGQRVWQLNVKSPGLAIHPTRPLLALVTEGRVDLVPREGEKAGTSTLSVTVPGRAEYPVWSPDGQYLAVPSSNGRIYLWDGSGELWGSVNCDQEGPLQVFFHPRFDLLATTGWDLSQEKLTRLWDLHGGREELTLPGRLLGFSADGRRLILRNGEHLAVWEMLTPACRVLGASRVQARGTEKIAVLSVDYSPDGRLLATAAADGVRLWDPATGHEVGNLPPAGDWEEALFDPDGSGLWRFQGKSSAVWPVRTTDGPAAPEFQVGPPRAFLLGPTDADPRVKKAEAAVEAVRRGKQGLRANITLTWAEINHAAWDGQGHRLAAVDRLFARIFVFDRQQLAGPPRLVINPDAAPDDDWANRDVLTLRHPFAHWVDLSRDGNRVATGTEYGKGVVIWDVATGERLREMPVPGSAFVRFSPGGEHLVTAEGNTYRSWHVGDGAPGPTFTTQGMDGVIGRVAFSPDGRLLAVVHDRRLVKLLDAATFAELATLRAASPQPITGLCFRPDGAQLAVATASRQVHLWDVHGIRRRLAAMRLDWGPDTPREDGATEAPPLRVEVLSH